MRHCILLPLILLAACGPAPDQPQQTVRDSPPAPSAAPAPVEHDPSTARPAPASVDTLPVALRGRWTGQKNDCADPAADMQLTIAPRELLFHESAGTVTSVEPLPDGGARVAARFTGEGQSWNRTLTLTPSADGRLLTVTGDGVSAARKRCPDTP